MIKFVKFGPGVPGHHLVAVGLDQSYTGFGMTAISLDDSSFYHTAVGSFPSVDFKSDAERLAAIQSHLKMFLCTGIRVKAIAMEGYAAGAKFGREVAGELGGAVKLAIHELGMDPPLIVSPGQLKKYVTGKGTGVQKSQMLLETYKRFGAEFSDDNAADSYGLARIAGGFSTEKWHPELLAKISA